jgi:hypothetical protein
MERLDVAWSTEYIDAPDYLECVATLEDVTKIRAIAAAVKGVSNDIFGINYKGVLFGIPKDSEFRSDVNYTKLYIDLFTGDILCTPYFQGKWDASDQIEGAPFSLDTLEEYLLRLEN